MSPTLAGVRRIEPVFVERIWGRTDLAPLYGTFQKPVGEVWFPAGPDFPLLIKFLFTSEKLSIQVHPDDKYAAEHENSRGKTEMWHVLAAEPGATIALGFREPVSRDTLRQSIENGTVVDLMNWVPVRPGDTLFAAAGTVHAIGGGIVLCEIQQNSDVTYRLCDYGRGRELHLEKGLAVSDLCACEGRREFPVCCEHFTTDVLELSAVKTSDISCEHLLITIEGAGTIDGQRFGPGECWLVSAASSPVELAADGHARLLRAQCGSPTAI